MWIYKWRAFGTPGWDLSWVSLWDGVGGRSWFSLNHLPDLPELPRGLDAARAIAAKLARNVPALLLELTRGPRALWIGALAIALLALRRDAERAAVAPPEPAGGHEPVRASASPGPSSFLEASALAAAGLAAVLVLALSLIATAASVPITRYLFPARVVAEPAGILALGALLLRAPETMVGSFGRRFLWIGLAVLAIAWGGFRTADGWHVARSTAEARGLPSESTLRDLAARLDRELPPGEPVMSNLGPVLAWHGRRPVVHLALSPADLEFCRRRLDFRVVVLVFRDARRAWPAWQEVIEHPEEAASHPEWNVVRAVRFDTADGFVGVWLDLGPIGAPVAGNMK